MFHEQIRECLRYANGCAREKLKVYLIVSVGNNS
jgi:hypothetical protein